MGVVGNSGLVGYSLSKGALIAGCKSLSIELAKRGIRVNTISPGHISDSQMSIEKEILLDKRLIEEIELAHPLGIGKSVDIANATIFLLSAAAKWITGTNLIVDGGYCAK